MTVRRPLRVLRITTPRCSRVFGVGACESVADHHCYNTDPTCTFIPGLDLTETIEHYYVENRAWPWIDVPDAFQPSLAIPALGDVEVAPTILNISSGDPDVSPFGARSVATFRLLDFAYNDLTLDPYPETRTGDPYDRGTYWSKWVAIHAFYEGYEVDYFEGYEGDALDDMLRRTYRVDHFDRARGMVRLTAKDPLSDLNSDDITMPRVSPGELAEAMGASVDTLKTIGATEDDYPESGLIRIGNELMRYTGRSHDGSNLNITGLSRGVLESTAAAHAQFERVQLCIEYENEPFQNILYDALVEYGGVDPAIINKDQWDSLASRHRAVFLFTGTLTEAIPVARVAAEISQDSLSHFWWDERNRIIPLDLLQPLREITLWTDETVILEDTFLYTERRDERVTNVKLLYGLRNVQDSVTDDKSYARIAEFADIDRARQYGGVRTKVLRSRWVQSEAVANAICATFLRRFRNPRQTVTLNIDAKDIAQWTGDLVLLDHFLLSGAEGTPLIDDWVITSAQPLQAGITYRMTMERAGLLGSFWEWVDGSEVSATWDDATTQERETVGYWLNDDGTDAGGTPRSFRWL